MRRFMCPSQLETGWYRKIFIITANSDDGIIASVFVSVSPVAQYSINELAVGHSLYLSAVIKNAYFLRMTKNDAVVSLLNYSRIDL